MKYIILCIYLFLGAYISDVYAANVDMEVKLEILSQQSEIEFDENYRGCIYHNNPALCDDIVMIDRKQDVTLYEVFIGDEYTIYQEKNQ